MASPDPPSPPPLAGLSVIELAAMAPTAFAGMLLADLGADVIRIDRTDGTGGTATTRADAVHHRGRRSLAVDLKHDDGAEVVRRLVDGADVLLEGFRPGVLERLGLGPDACLARNGRLVYGRLTGWGQDGPLAQTAGHDIDYVAVAGALAHLGRPEGAPVPPLNLLGDFAGGSLYLVTGVLAALLERERSGRGQVVDAAMVDGVANLMAMFWGMRAAGLFDERRGHNVVDTGAPFYDVYECADGAYVAIGAIEPPFFAELCRRAGVDLDGIDQDDRASWPELRERLRAAIGTKGRDEWGAVFEGSDACVAPVLTMTEAAVHPQLAARGTIVRSDGVEQPAPAPRFSRTTCTARPRAGGAGADTVEVLLTHGFTEEEVAALVGSGVVRQRRI